MLFAANLSMLWAELPLAERFERAARAGFGAVELWWPGALEAQALPGLTARWDLRLVLLNFAGGDFAAGQRGLAADPGRREQLRANVPAALRVAAECGCPRLNLLMIEAINPMDNGPYLLTTTAAAAGFITRVARPNVRLQYDACHMQRTEGDLVATLDAHWPLISHIQIADVPGRHEPGTGEINYLFVLDHLESRGYQGAVALEYQPSTARTEDSLAWLRDYQAARAD